MLLAQLQWYSIGPLLIGLGALIIVSAVLGAVIHALWTGSKE